VLHLSNLQQLTCILFIFIILGRFWEDSNWSEMCFFYILTIAYCTSASTCQILFLSTLLILWLLNVVECTKDLWYLIFLKENTFPSMWFRVVYKQNNDSMAEYNFDSFLGFTLLGFGYWSFCFRILLKSWKVKTRN